MSASDITLLPALLLTYLLHSTIAIAGAMLFERIASSSPAQRAAAWRAAAIGPLFTTLSAVARNAVVAHASRQALQPASATAIFAIFCVIAVAIWGFARVGSLAVRDRRLATMLRSARVRSKELQDIGEGFVDGVAGWRRPRFWTIDAHADSLLSDSLKLWPPGAPPDPNFASGRGESIAEEDNVRQIGPFAGGSTDIYLPRSAAHLLDGQELRAVLAHEVAHIRRCDPLWTRAVAYIAAASPVQPLNALALRRSIEWAELASDDIARTFAEPHALARSIVSVAEWSVRLRPATSLSGTASILHARVHRLLALDAPAPRRIQRVAVVVASCIAFGLLAVRGPSFTPHRQVIAIRNVDTATRVIASEPASATSRLRATTRLR